MLEKIEKNIKKRGSNQNKETYRDITDGKVYWEICSQFDKSGFHWLSCIFNTDEIPARERFFSKNIILFGLWQG